MNEDPYEVLKEGKIREDLFYRTGVVQIKLPPLQERREDIMPLTETFIERFNRELNRDIQMIYEEKLSLSEAVDQYEKELIKRVLERSKNMAEAAKRLKLSRQSLKYKKGAPFKKPANAGFLKGARRLLYNQCRRTASLHEGLQAMSLFALFFAQLILNIGPE